MGRCPCLVPGRDEDESEELDLEFGRSEVVDRSDAELAGVDLPEGLKGCCRLADGFKDAASGRECRGRDLDLRSVH